MAPIAFAAAVISTSQDGELRTYQDWIVACDTRQICRATPRDLEATPERSRPGVDLGTENLIAMVLCRDPGPHATPRLHLLPCAQCAPNLAPDPAGVGEMSVIDAAGKVIFSLQLSARETRHAIAQRGLSFPADSGLFTAMAHGERLTFSDRSFRAVASVSLRGAREALGAIDVSQGRAGTVKALIDRGGGASN